VQQAIAAFTEQLIAAGLTTDEKKEIRIRADRKEEKEREAKLEAKIQELKGRLQQLPQTG
jgi:hypothetical protein